MTLYKIFKYLAIVIGVVALFFAIRVIVAGEEAVKTSADLQASIVSPFMYITYIVLAIAIVLTLIFTIKGLFKGDVKETLISLGAMAAIVLVSYLVTSGEPYQMNDGEVLSASAVHWVSAGLVIFYILGIVAIGAMLFGGIKRITK